MTHTAATRTSPRAALVAPLRALALVPVLPVAAVLLHRSRPTEGCLTPAWSSSEALWSAASPSVEISVVMPFFNPGPSMRPTVIRLVEGLRAEGVGFEVICVSDGSTDGSEHSLYGIADEVRVLVNPANRGKGAALHTGFAHAHGRYIGMVDCDGDIDPLHLVDFLHRARATGADAVYADKRLAESTSKSSALRKLVSLGFSTMVGTLFALGVADTQTGCKLFTRETLQTVLPRLAEERFAFDLEFFVAAKAAGRRHLHAAPIHLSERLAGSTVTTSAILRTLTDALTVFGRLHLTRRYRAHVAAPTAVADARPALIDTMAGHRIPAQTTTVYSRVDQLAQAA